MGLGKVCGTQVVDELFSTGDHGHYHAVAFHWSHHTLCTFLYILLAYCVLCLCWLTLLCSLPAVLVLVNNSRLPACPSHIVPDHDYTMHL